MFSDLDYRHGEVVEDVNNWGAWVVKEFGLSGFRFDAIQHFSQRFTNQFMHHVDKETGAERFYVGEYWSGGRHWRTLPYHQYILIFALDAATMLAYGDKFDHRCCFYDAPLVYNFSRISTEEDADLRKVFDKTLVSERPMDAVTVVMNHDTQPGQTVETPVEGFFKPLAYCLILLRNAGYPCPFYGDL